MPTVYAGFENGGTFAPLSAAWMHPLALCDAAHPVTETLFTEPFDENVICARETSSAPATQAFAPSFTLAIAAFTEPCGGCSGMLWLLEADAGSASSLVAPDLGPPSAPTACAIAPWRSPGFAGVAGADEAAGAAATFSPALADADAAGALAAPLP